MFTVLYLFFWVLLSIILVKIGFDISTVEFWSVFAIVIVIVQLKERLTEFDIMKKIEDRINNGL